KACFRFDAWETADAMRLLQRCRENDATGLAVGVDGLVEGNGFGAMADSPVFRAAPSVEHAATAAALHQARDALKDSGEEGIADIDLSSERVRNSLDFAESLRRGLDPAEALGRFAERFIANAGRSELTPPLARALPLR